MWTFSGHNGRVFVASASDIARVTFPPVLLRLRSKRAQRLSPFNKAFTPNSCLSPRMDAMAASSTVDTTEHKGGRDGGRAIGAEQMPPPTHCPVGCHRRESGYQIDRRATTERRPPAKEHSRLLSGRIYLFGAFDIVGFSALSLPPSDALLSAPVQSGCPPTERCPRAAGTVASQHKIRFRTALSIEPQLPRYLWPGLVCKLYPVGRFASQPRSAKKV